MVGWSIVDSHGQVQAPICSPTIIQFHIYLPFSNTLQFFLLPFYTAQSLPKFCSPACLKAKFRKFSIYSNKFFNNFYLPKSSFICPSLWVSWLAQRYYSALMGLKLFTNID